METARSLSFDAQAVLSAAKEADYIAVDTETTGQDMEMGSDIRDGSAHALGLSIACRQGKNYYSAYFPFRHLSAEGKHDPDNYGPEIYRQVVDIIQGTPNIIFHNAKFDIVSLRTLGIDVTQTFFDTMLMAHLVNENTPVSKSLDSCAKYYLGGYGKEKSAELDFWIKHLGWATVPAKLMEHYASTDALVTFKLFEELVKKIDYRGHDED